MHVKVYTLLITNKRLLYKIFVSLTRLISETAGPILARLSYSRRLICHGIKRGRGQKVSLRPIIFDALFFTFFIITFDVYNF